MSDANGTLFVVGTPIGNLGDLTRRAIDTLGAADRVLAEDTRRTRGLLSHLGISGKPLERLDANAGERDLARALGWLAAGETLALVSDAGMPSVSDPGTALVRAARAAGAKVVVVPGPSAVTTAVALSGLVDGGFRFVGFLPRAGGARAEAIATVAATPEPVVLFESPGRATATLRDLAARMPERRAVVARELTKLHEEASSGTLAELAALEREWLGEITMVLGPHDASAEVAAPDDAELELRIDAALAEGVHPKVIAERIARLAGTGRREAYERVLARKRPPRA